MSINVNVNITTNVNSDDTKEKKPDKNLQNVNEIETSKDQKTSLFGKKEEK